MPFFFPQKTNSTASLPTRKDMRIIIDIPSHSSAATAAAAIAAATAAESAFSAAIAAPNAPAATTPAAAAAARPSLAKYNYYLNLLTLPTMVALLIVRALSLWKKESPFETNGDFMVASILSLLGAELITGILYMTNSLFQKTDYGYIALQIGGTRLAILAIYSLLMVAVLPPNLNVIGYFGAFLLLLPVCLLYHYSIVVRDLGEKHDVKYGVFIFLRLALVAILFAPYNHNHYVDWIEYMVILTFFKIENNIRRKLQKTKERR